MSEIKIEKGVPLPAKDYARNVRYPWRHMDVGDSFVVPKPIATTGSMVSWANRNYAGRKFTARKVDDNSARVWRTA